MSIDLWGMEGRFGLDLPAREVGYLFLSLAIVAIAALVFASLREGDPGPRSYSRLQWGLALIFLLAGPLASGVLWVRMPAADLSISSVSLSEPSTPTIALLAALPWMLAGGILGTWQAVLVGLLAGFVRGGWQTGSLLTPFLVAIQAGLVSWLMRRRYSEWPGRVVRHPAFSSLVGGAAYGLLRGFEFFAHSGGGSYEGLDHTLTLLGPAILVSLIEVGIAGLLCEGFRRIWPQLWFRPERLIVGPYRRSLTARLVTVLAILGISASGILLYGDWLLARTSAQEMLERQLAQTASQAAEGIPFFFQTGRALMREFADGLGPQLLAQEISLEQPAAQLRSFPFFTTLAAFDPQGQQLATIRLGLSTSETDALALRETIALTLDSGPQELVLAASSEVQPAQMIFMAPVRDPEDGQPLGVVAGWTELVSNPMLLPVSQHLAQVSPGEALVVDAEGQVLIHDDPGRWGTYIDLASEADGQLLTTTATDGTRQFSYARQVPEYAWYVVVSVPQREVNTLAVRMAARVFVLLAAVGGTLMLLVYATSRRLTKPLGQMAGVAESIASGNLAQPVEAQGEDEIGRLAVSFEHMRQRLKSRLDEMDLLLKVREQLASSFQLRQVFPPILSALQRLTLADVVRLVLLSAGGGASEEKESYQAGEDPGNWAALDEQILGLSQERGQFILENPSRARAVLDLTSIKVPLEMLLGLPIMHEEAFVGVLWLGHRAPHTYSASDIDLLTILTGQLGDAVANARLFHLAEQERMRLAAVLDATPDGVIVIDHAGLISLANPSAEVFLRGKASEACGKQAAEWIAARELEDLLLVGGDEPRTAEIHLEGGGVYFASVTDIPTGSPESMGRVCVLWEITRYKKLDMLKSEFVATVSHDLRAPLTLMRGYATVLPMVGAQNEQQQEFAAKILDSIDQMSRLVDNLLDLGRIEAEGVLAIDSVRVDAVIQDVIEAYQPQAVNKGVELEGVIEEDNQPIEADATLLRQSIANLVDNAIKYTPQGGRVTVRAFQAGERQIIRVEDTGIGIAPADQARLFEKFYRARRAETLQKKGSGLGLAIVKSIVEQHGGKVTVESELGVGSSFILDLPMYQPEAA